MQQIFSGQTISAAATMDFAYSVCLYKIDGSSKLIIIIIIIIIIIASGRYL